MHSSKNSFPKSLFCSGGGGLSESFKSVRVIGFFSKITSTWYKTSLYRRSPLKSPQSLQNGSLDCIQILPSIEIIRRIPGGVKGVRGVMRSVDAGGIVGGRGENVCEFGFKMDGLVKFVIGSELGIKNCIG